MEKEITSKLLRKNKALIYSTIIELTFQMAFLHWSIHDKKKSYIYTIQNAILSIYLFKIASPIEDALKKVLNKMLKYLFSFRVSPTGQLKE
jgi:hypothetical protein